MAAVDEFGEDFTRLPLHEFPGRSLAQLRSHYHNQLKDTIEKDNWSREEDKKLLSYVEVYGHDWIKISQLFNKRFTRMSCRTRFYTITRYLAKCPSHTIENVPRRKRKRKQNINIDNWMTKLHELPSLPSSQESPKPATKRIIKTFYVDKLRANEKSLYEYFKYSFEYSYGHDFQHVFTEFLSLQLISKALEYEEIFSATDNFPKTLPVIVLNNLIGLGRNSNRIDGSVNLPPSWGTLLGLRSLLIFKSAAVNKGESSYKQIKVEQSEIDYNELDCHKLLFKRRLRKIFLKTSLLSFLHSTEFRPNCSIEFSTG